ncbi:DUF7144 family membrane protein [Nonomuraea sp. NPDC004354]
MTTASTPHGPTFRQPMQTGWYGFAGMLGVMMGVFNVIEGFIALVKESYFLAPDGRLLVLDYNTWGWIWLVIGALQIATGAGLLMGQGWARWAGIFMAALAMLGQFLFIAAFPIWSLIGIGVCIMIIYGLIVTPQG